jgi:hypothetical protein
MVIANSNVANTQGKHQRFAGVRKCPIPTTFNIQKAGLPNFRMGPRIKYLRI